MEREEIVKALRICASDIDSCELCPAGKFIGVCKIDAVAADLIEQQAARIAELEAQLAAHEQALAVEDVAVAYLEICDRNCAGDWTTEIPQCRFYNPPDIGAFGEPLPCGCELEDYCEHHAEAALKEQEAINEL